MIVKQSSQSIKSEPVKDLFDIISRVDIDYLQNTEEKELISTFSANLKQLPDAQPDSDTMAWWKTQPEAWNRIIYKQMPIQEVTIHPDDIVVSAHACGSLTDLIIEKAIEQRARVAVLPCCHNLKESSTDGLEGWMDKTLAVDAARAMSLKSKGYQIVTQTIPDDITPKNRLLMGEYRKN